MLKPTATYKMSKTAKRMLANYTDPIHRGIMKKGVIQAELHSKIAPKREKRKPQDLNTDNAGE